MLPRYLRFARTVALVTTAATAGCRGDDADGGASATKDTGARDVLAETASDAPADATVEVDGDADADPDADLDSAFVTRGTCRLLVLEGGFDIPCGAGGMCSYPENDAGDADPLLCTFGIDAAAAEGGVGECGLITCGANCYCAGPAVHMCGCLHLGSAGPLAPPDLPRA